ncbi:MAG TPA: SUMF1/EgtB/PvdO family nonheme iron enzyme [Planctomycetota bacterium]|nr:SUMF1/EgtB/PvdO family nonheme iron enzyme [Planctomycetota bacterium]
MAAPEPGPGGDAIEIFAGWLSRRERGELLEFDELLRGHPQLAAELTELEATWKRLAAASDSADPSLSLPEPIGSRFGEPEAPAREQGKGQAPVDFASLLIAQLSAHGSGFGRYRIRGEVARGGMGLILKIWDRDLRRHLAMKVILGRAEAPTSGATPPVDASRIARFVEEAQVTGQLDHPGIVPVHELGLDPEGRLYFTMKLVKGRSLKEIFDLVKDGKEGWTETRALGVLLKVCEAMAYAHDKGVIHRDLKPGNIMVGKFGEVHVMDWGLARILDQQDHKDIRVREQPLRSTVLRSDRDRHRGETAESPLYTMDGDVVGTPAYMPPEQAAGSMSEVGPHSDVYALGAMLYHLLAGHMPYVPSGARLSAYAVWSLVQQGPPTPIAQLSPGTPAELVAICDKAMARDWKKRYRDVSELAADFSAYVEHRVVAAYETGTWAETKKWVERNKPLAASLVAAVAILLAGAIGTTTFALDARQQARRADEKTRAEAEARRDADRNAMTAREQERLATERANDLLSLSAIQDLDDLIARAERLWPAHPENIPAYEEWLRDARALIAGRPADEARGVKGRAGLAEHKRNLAELEQRALPQSDEGRAAERASYPRAAELVEKRSRVEWMARLLGKSPWPSEAEVEASLEVLSPAPADAQGWNAVAWTLIVPDRRTFGGEVKALLCARRALDAATDEDRYLCRDTLAWALFSVGRFDEAQAQERESLQEAPGTERGNAQGSLRSLERSIANWRTPSGELEPAREREWSDLTAEVEQLELEASARREWTFADSQDRWWHVLLSKLVAGLEAFADPRRGLYSSGISQEHGWGIEKRLDFARSIEDRSVSGPEASRRWAEAIASVRDPVPCPMYAGLVLAPQLGLLPIGRDPQSGLWEFADLQTGDPAQRGPDGTLIVNEGTGLVFVLIPGGTFWMGAQHTDAAAANYDPSALDSESPVHEVVLSPYMLSKYEMTQGQWLRIAGRNPSAFSPASRFSTQFDLSHPVEQVRWTDCMQLLGSLGLALPSEAQWEFGCRGGTATPWWTGAARESLRGRVNVADQAARRAGAAWADIEDWPDQDDGWPAHAPVGSLAGNPYGLHEVHGNVSEWCQDGYAAYPAEKRTDPLAPSSGATCIYRGGDFNGIAWQTRSTSRNHNAPDSQGINLGLRPARSLGRQP